MKKEYYKTDESGYAVTTNPESPANQLNFECIHLKEDEEIPEDYILAPDGTVPLWLPKWTGSEWVEGLTQEEIDEINNVPHEPTEIEQLRLEQAQANAEMVDLILAMILGGL